MTCVGGERGLGSAITTGRIEHKSSRHPSHCNTPFTHTHTHTHTRARAPVIRVEHELYCRTTIIIEISASSIHTIYTSYVLIVSPSYGRGKTGVEDGCPSGGVKFHKRAPVDGADLKINGNNSYPEKTIS